MTLEGTVVFLMTDGKGDKPKLKQEHSEQIKEWIKQFPKQLAKVCQKIKEVFELSVSKKTLKRFLKKHLDFSWRRTRKTVKGKPDPDVYDKKKKELEELEEQAKQGQIDLWYFDESGFSLTSSVPYAWQGKGDTIKIEAASGKRLNVVGFLNPNQDGLFSYTFENTITSDVVIACFDEFSKTITKESVVVIDNASIHTSKAFTAKIDEWKQKDLTIFNLPEYSPQLNRIEILWRFMKYDWIDFDAYKSWETLITYVENIIKYYGSEYQIKFA